MIRIKLIVEGATEREFVSKLLTPYFSDKNIFFETITIDGNVEFQRVFRNIRDAMKKDQKVYVSTMFDFYGIHSKWPGRKDIESLIKTGSAVTSLQIGEALNKRLEEEVKKNLGDNNINTFRFIPYFQIYEFEALVFCDQNILAAEIGCNPNATAFKEIDFNNPEMINGRRDTSPSHRLGNVFELHNQVYYKYTGIEITKEIGIETMRQKCPNFNAWLKELENLKPLH